MKLTRTIYISVFLALTAGAWAQAWMDSYEKALAALRTQSWGAARAAFREAVQDRSADSNKGTTLKGPVTDRKMWRNGAPYSANFGAAYAGLKQAFATRDDAERAALLREAATEFEALLAKKQNSKETFYFLNIAYSSLGDREGQSKLDAQFQKLRKRLTWKIDPELITPEDAASIENLAKVDLNSTGGSAAIELQNPTVDSPRPRPKPKDKPVKQPDPAQEPEQDQPKRPTNPTNPNIPPPPKRATTDKPTGPTTIDPATLTPGGGTAPEAGVAGKVAVVPSKFAFIIANSTSKIQDATAPEFASNDAELLKATLIQDAGYAEENIMIVTNADAGQMEASARALAEKVPEDGAVLIYYAGAGVNIDGKDFLAGIDAESATDSGKMLAKGELYRPFVAKGARIFAFFEVPRPVINGRFFGVESPMAGAISQVQATIPGAGLFTVIRNGKPVGVFTSAFVSVLTDFRSNRVPILEFSWQVFYRMRRGNSGSEGGGSLQTPTLPTLTNLASDAKF